MASNSNIGYAFPLEKLGSDIARNNYNYQSILNGLIEWNNTTADTVNIRLTKDTDPWFEDYQIPSKKAVFDMGSFNCTIDSIVASKSFAVDCNLEAALYGGSKLFTTASIDSATGVNISTDVLTLDNGSDFDVTNAVKIEPNVGATLPSPLSATTLYYVVAKPTTNEIQLSETESGSAIDITDIGSGTFTITKKTVALLPDTSDLGDIVTIRASVEHAGDTSWELYYAVALQEWTSGTSYKADNIVIYDDVYYKTYFDVESSTVAPDTDTANFEALIKTWTPSSTATYRYGELVVDSSNGNVYIVNTTDVSSAVAPSASSSFDWYAPDYSVGLNYVKGQYVYDSGRLFVAQTAILSSTTSPSADTTGSWEEMILYTIPVANPFISSSVFRWSATTNTSKIIARNVGTVESNDSVNINIRLSIKTKEPSSIYQPSMDLFSTCNYSMWPQDKNAVWTTTDTYGPTDTTVPITKRQNYSAAMIFDHTRPDVAKTTNYINYTGPDLDQGLCIYLPVTVDIGDGGIAYPEDGFTYEFFFRIWPNVDLNDATTRDHIVNKSQIYVYSALDKDTIYSDTCEEPIAKFSMARTTNFYMFGENVSIPDKPVCYRATFKYSEADQKWCTFDYYQLPDHVFVGPVGFIDPQNPANLDINDEVIGNINPNAEFIGYETAAFPMFQDPFSRPNLTPYRFNGDEDDVFKNRIVQ